MSPRRMKIVCSLCFLCFLCSAVACGQGVRFERIQLSAEFFSEGGTHGDYNQDGDGDVAVGPWIYWGPDFAAKTQFYDGEAIDPIGYSKNFLMFSDDVNADGRLDILVLGFPGAESWWYENPGDWDSVQASGLANRNWTQHTILDVVDNESPLIADIDGDNVLDLICSSRGKYLFASHAKSDPTKPWSVTEVSPAGGYQRFAHGLGIGDVDNDGHRDLLEKDGWWRNPGASGGSPWKFNPFAFSATGGAQMHAVDLDGDGRNEVLTSLVAHGFGLAYYKATNREATQFQRVDILTDAPETSAGGLAIGQLHAVEVADINRDGIPDIVTGKRWWAHANKDAGNSEPALLVWLETQRRGERVEFIPHTIDTSSGVGTQITVGDVNGDGLPDIVSGIKRGAYLFLQRPSGLADNELLVPGLAQNDPFDQLPAVDALTKAGNVLPALGERPLNFGFESGDLADWEMRGPIASGALVQNDPKQAESLGKYSIDTNVETPRAIGELISRPFALLGNRASCYLGGPTDEETRFELVSENSGKVLFTSRGHGGEGLELVEMDVQPWQGQLVRMRLVDHSESASIRFDEFRLHHD